MQTTRRSGAPPRGTRLGAALAVGLCVLASVPAEAQQAPAANGPIWNGRQHQPTATGVGETAGTGAAPETGRDASQLRDLNALSRELSPGSPVPAPEADRGSPPRR